MPTKKVREDAEGESTLGIEAFELPKSTLLRLARGAIPENVKMAKETSLALSKASTVFVGYLAGIAHDIADDRQQKTITSTHVLEAVRMLGWPDSQELYDFLKAKQTAYKEAALNKQKLPIQHDPLAAAYLASTVDKENEESHDRESNGELSETRTALESGATRSGSGENGGEDVEMNGDGDDEEEEDDEEEGEGEEEREGEDEEDEDDDEGEETTEE